MLAVERRLVRFVEREQRRGRTGNSRRHDPGNPDPRVARRVEAYRLVLDLLEAGQRERRARVLVGEEPHGGALACTVLIASVKLWFSRWFETNEHVPAVDVAVRLYQRDREGAGSVVGSAIAFRLFLFFVPLLLFLVGVAGFISGFVSSRDVNNTAGLSGALADQIRTAFAQPGGTRWVATLVGLVGMVTAGRSLSKVLWSASTAAWRLPPSSKASLRVVGSVAGLVAGMGLVAALVNRVREGLGLGVASVSFLVAFVVYLVSWMVISVLLPRATSDPGALLPGAAFVALALSAMHAASQFYLPDHLGRAASCTARSARRS